MKRRCPTGKMMYRDRLAAQIVLAGRYARDKGEIREYRCNLCGRWHLTSQPLKRSNEA